MVTSSETWEVQRVTSGRIQSVYIVMKTDRDEIGSADIIVSSRNANSQSVFRGISDVSSSMRGAKEFQHQHEMHGNILSKLYNLSMAVSGHSIYV